MVDSKRPATANLRKSSAYIDSLPSLRKHPMRAMRKPTSPVNPSSESEFGIPTPWSTSSPSAAKTSKEPAAKRLRVAKEQLKRAGAEASCTLHDVAEEFEDMKKTLQAKSHVLEHFQQSHSIIREELVALKARNRTLDASNRRSEARSSRLEAQKTKLLRDLDRVKANESELKDTITRLQEATKLARKNRRALDKKLSRARGSESELKEKVVQLTYDNEYERKRREDVEQELGRAHVTINSFESENSVLKDNINNLTVENSGLQTQADSLKKEICTLKSKVGSLKHKIGNTGLEEDVNSLKKENGGGTQ